MFWINFKVSNYTMLISQSSSFFPQRIARSHLIITSFLVGSIVRDKQNDGVVIMTSLLELLHHIGHDVVDSPGDGDIDPRHWPLNCSLLSLWRLKHGETFQS